MGKSESCYDKRQTIFPKKQEEGLYVYYGRGHILEQSITYKNGMKNGPYKYWWPSGELAEESYYKNDLLHGSYKRWAGIDDIHKIEEAFYVDGKMEGERRVWFLDGGAIYKIENYKAGVLHGHYRQYAHNGSLAEECIYEDGVVVKRFNHA
jgi:antitoxin component YwqK of YwqJK toxin-antitoxin module